MNLQQTLKNPFTPFYLKGYLENLENEDPQFAADEVAALAEATLHYFNGLVIMTYIRGEQHTEKLDQGVLDYFTSTRHAGDVYRTLVTKILLFLDDHPLAEKLLDKVNGTYRKDINDLATLRNEIMHGLFVLPPETNHKNTNRICALLEDFFKDDFVRVTVQDDMPRMNGMDMRPFFTVTYDDDNPQVTINEDLRTIFDAQGNDVFQGTGSFYALYQKSLNEAHENFVDEQLRTALNKKISLTKGEQQVVNEVLQFLKKPKGHIWIHGEQPIRDKISGILVQNLNQKDNTVLIYNLENTGLKYTALFALKQLFLRKGLTIKKGHKERPEKYIEKLKNEKSIGHVIFIINDVDKRQFSEQHFLSLMDDFYTLGIRVIGLSDYYPSLSKFFNASQAIPSNQKEKKLSAKAKKTLLQNYLYDTGPDQAGDRNEQKAYDEIKKAVNLIWKKVNEENFVNLRNLAGNKNKFSFIMLEEAADIIAPYIEQDTVIFEPTEWDPLTDMPVKETESSLIYTILGRHDIRMEYEQPVIFLPENRSKWQAKKKRLLDKYAKIQEKIDNPMLYLEALEQEQHNKNNN